MLLPGQRLKRCPGYVDYDLPGRIVAAGYAEQRWNWMMWAWDDFPGWGKKERIQVEREEEEEGRESVTVEMIRFQ